MNARYAIAFVTGLYIGKYFPQYVPLPRINQDTFQQILTWLEAKQREMS
jgi:hypothetical protein